MRASVSLTLVALTLAACAGAQIKRNFDTQFGPERIHHRLVANLPAGRVDYWSEVEPVLESRCVVCHGCFDAPCQLKQDAPEGLDRGASKDKVFEPSRLLAANPSRLFEDAPSTDAWRQKGFRPVLNEREPTLEANRAGSVLYQMLQLKKRHPLPKQAVLEGFDFSIDRKQTCPTIEEFASYAEEKPTGGMPYGLPGLSEAEANVIERWVEQGALFTPRPGPPADVAREIDTWEELLNRPDDKSRLIARYLYEHLFMAHLYFADLTAPDATPRYFELVRSRSAPGKPVDRLANRRPFEDPELARVYYRFEALKTTVLVKNHLPYALNGVRLARYKELFFDAPFTVDKLPSYEPERAANPFATFAGLPVGSRYRFLLDEAQFILDGFIKGPVCHGQVALNVINDRFWVLFADPDEVATAAEAEFYAKESPELELPAGDESTTGLLKNWLKYSGKQKAYLEARAAFLNAHFPKARDVTLDLIWQGEGHNINAALTVMRHEDSASVVRGLVGSPPKTSWVLGYGLLERIHYLLVAGFDVYGNVGHQVTTRLYMDFLRMEAEMNFLAFLPRDARSALRDKWYEGAEDEAREYINSADASFVADSGLHFDSMNPELELYEKLQTLLAPTANRSYDLSGDPEPRMKELNIALTRLVGGPARLFPPLSFLELVPSTGASRYYTIVRDDWHTNITSMFSEGDNRRPEQDRLTIARGFIGSYPNALFKVAVADIPEFTKMVLASHWPADYARLKDRFGVRRSSDDFWAFSDRLHSEQRKLLPIAGGLFDYNRLENR